MTGGYPLSHNGGMKRKEDSQMHAAVRVTTNELIQLPTYDALKQAQLQASDDLVMGTYNPETGVFTSDDDKLVVDFGAEQMTTIATEVISPEVLAAKDVRVLDVIEDMLLDQQYDATMTDDLVLAIQEYMQDERANKSALALIADNAKLRGVFKLVQQIRNSEPFAALVAENEEVVSDQSSVVSKPVVVATNTTAQAIAQQSQAKAEEVISNQSSVVSKKPAKGQKSPKKSNEAKAPKTPKSKTKQPMPTIASLEALEAMSRGELMKAMGAINDHHKTGVRANGTSLDMKTAIAKYCLNTTYVAPPQLTKEERKYTIELTKNGHAFNITGELWVNDMIDGATGFAGHIKALVKLGGTYQDDSVTLKLITGKTKASKTKTPKQPKVEAILDLPEGLSWDECKDMNYRQLQGVCKILRSQKLYSGNLAGKGINKDHLKNVVKEYFRSQGVEIIEATITSQGPAKDLHLPNWGAVKEQKRLERVATEALRMDATDAKAHMELAVAA